MKTLIVIILTFTAWNLVAQNSTVIAVFDAPYDQSVQKTPSSEMQYIEAFDRYTFSPIPGFTCRDIDYNLGREVAPWYQLHISEIIDYDCEVIINAREADPIILKSLNKDSQLSRLNNLSIFPIRKDVNKFRDTKPVHGLEIDIASIEKEFPELIHYGEKGSKGTYTLKFIPILIKALQEQRELTQSSKNQLQTQQKEIDNLTTEIEEIKSLMKKMKF